MGIKVVESGAKWIKVVDSDRFYLNTGFPWQTTCIAESVWIATVRALLWQTLRAGD